MHYPVCLTSAFATYRAQSGCCLLHDLHFNHEKIHHMRMHTKWIYPNIYTYKNIFSESCDIIFAVKKKKICLKRIYLKSRKGTGQSKHYCGFSIYIFDNSKSKSMGRLVRAEKMVWSGLVWSLLER